MLKKKWIPLLLVVVLIATACGTSQTEPSAQEEPSITESTSEVKEFTLEELATHNGKDGAKAYVAVDGVVYDLTDSAAWKNGQHNGFEAGKDLTDEIKNDSPHGVGNLEGIPVVGKIVE